MSAASTARHESHEDVVGLTEGRGPHFWRRGCFKRGSVGSERSNMPAAVPRCWLSAKTALRRRLLLEVGAATDARGDVLGRV